MLLWHRKNRINSIEKHHWNFIFTKKNKSKPWVKIITLRRVDIGRYALTFLKMRRNRQLFFEETNADVKEPTHRRFHEHIWKNDMYKISSKTNGSIHPIGFEFCEEYHYPFASKYGNLFNGIILSSYIKKIAI